MPQAAPTETTTAEMAKILGVSTRRLQQLAAGEWIEGRIAHGRWSIPTTVQSFAQHQQLSALRGKDPSV